MSRNSRKSKASELRKVLYKVYINKGGEKGGFDKYYTHIMNKLIERYSKLLK